MPWTRGLIGYPHVKECLRRAKVYMMMSSRKANSKVNWSIYPMEDPISKDRSNYSGTHTLVKVGDNNNNNYLNRRRRNRKVIRFNPPFCKLTNIYIGKYFLHLLDKHFNRDNPLRKIFNRNTLKISYSCTKNMHNILNNRNRRLLDELIKNSGRPDVVSCNCRSKAECPLDRRCNLRNVVYQACISPMEHNNDGWGENLYRHLCWELETKII